MCGFSRSAEQDHHDFRAGITKQYPGKLQTIVEDMNQPKSVIRSHHGNSFMKQYVRDHVLLCTEASSSSVNDYGCKKAIEHLSELRQKMSSVIDTYHNFKQDIPETFVDRGRLRKLAEPRSCQWQTDRYRTDAATINGLAMGRNEDSAEGDR
jgi:hypothetical protein